MCVCAHGGVGWRYRSVLTASAGISAALARRYTCPSSCGVMPPSFLNAILEPGLVDMTSFSVRGAWTDERSTAAFGRLVSRRVGSAAVLDFRSLDESVVP